MLHRIREACKGEEEQGEFLKGIVEADETYIGGKEANKHESKKLKAGRGTIGKTPVLGMRQRNGHFKGIVLNDTTAESIQTELTSAIEDGATICSDEHSAYIGIEIKDETLMIPLLQLQTHSPTVKYPVLSSSLK